MNLNQNDQIATLPGFDLYGACKSIKPFCNSWNCQTIISIISHWNQACLSARIARESSPAPNSPLEEKKDSSSEELSMADVDTLKQELLKTMPEKQAEGIAGIFRKFTNATTDEQKFEGFVSDNLTMNIVAADCLNLNSISYCFTFRCNWWW